MIHPQYRLTERRLHRKAAEMNALIRMMLKRGLTPDITLRPVKGNPLARTVAVGGHWRRGR